ncbi:MAG: nucleotide pyrophosphohydrolase [Proteobacteria bacterium]|nr:MAG: nucleotide pyrophosphohydrolase [Pseudomonadota bacterium]
MDEFKILQNKLIAFRNAREWKQFHSAKNLATSVVIESAELLECFQWLRDDDINTINKIHVAEEMSDVLNYLLLLAEILDINLFESALKKIEKNGEKYPVEKSKGTSAKYNKI